MIAVPAGTLKFASMGSVVSGVYQTSPEGGLGNPKWTVSGLEAWNPVSAGEEIALGTATGDNFAEAIDIQTFADVGLMLSLGARGQVNSSVFIYNNSKVKISYTDFLEMELGEGTVFLKLESRSEIAQITLPNHQNAIAKLTGGSMLLHLNGDEVQLWCLKDDCSRESGRESERTFAVQRQSYFPAAGTVDPPMDIIPALYDELWAYNIKCNQCMDSNVVPQPTPTPTPTSTSWPTNTMRPTDTPLRATNTRTATFTPSYTPTITLTPTFTLTHTPTFTSTPEAYFTVTLSVYKAGSGFVTGGGTYPAGTWVTISASPKEGWIFSHWSGGYSGTDNPHTFEVTGDVSITAYFIPN
jgi:hypothetical protein